MMISAEVNGRLNEQITSEFFAAHTYLAMSCELEKMGLKILAKWFRHHAAEEREHGMKIVHYLQDVGGTVSLNAIPKPTSGLGSVEKIVAEALKHEQVVTRQINELMALADTEKDYATRSFVQWFVDEQVEEEAVVGEVLQLVQLAGDKHMLQVEARVARMLESKG